MSKQAPQDLSRWIARHSLLVWLGIVLNLFFVFMLLIDPAMLLSLFKIPADGSIWPRFAGLLLLIITIFYIPATIDLERYRVIAWMAVFPSRSFGAIFFFLAVFVFDQPSGFIAAILLDGLIGLSTLYCLIRVTKLERARGVAGGLA